MAGIIAVAGVCGQPVSGQDSKRVIIKDSREIEPREFGFELPAGSFEPCDGLNIATIDGDGRGCIARAHVKVGGNFIALLPNGGLVARMADKANVTDREFVPATPDEITRSLTGDRLKGFQVLKTERFVFIYNTTPEFAKVTSTVLETMLSGVLEYCKAQGLAVHEPAIPLPVIMFHREAQFQQYSPKPPGVLAYYEITTNRVVLHEESTFSGIDQDLARQDLLSTIAHEGAHQILHNIGVQQRLSRWPLWLGEGIAEYLAPTKPGLKFAWKGAGKINDLRMWELEGFLQKQFIKGFNGDSVNQTVGAGALDSSGYASAWTVTHFLAEQRKEDFDRYMRYLSRMPPLQGMLPPSEEAGKNDRPIVPGNLVHFRKFFGEDLQSFENEMVEFMVRQKFDSPFGGVPHLVCTVEIPASDGVKKHACFFPKFFGESNVKEWQSAVVESMTTYEKEHARVQLIEFRDRAEANRYIKKWRRQK
jgi:hypothetical protein